MLDSWWQLIVFYSLRLLIASIVETGILLDRVLFLAENGRRSQIIPVFDPKISPRNFAIISRYELSES
jgi:hypothetical protein